MSSDIFSVTGAQIRAARALVNYSGQQLAESAGIGLATLRRAEASEQQPNTTKANLKAIRSALEAAGVIFIDENGEGPGVRLKKST